jgi:hypothetical protein
MMIFADRLRVVDCIRIGYADRADRAHAGVGAG